MEKIKYFNLEFQTIEEKKLNKKISTIALVSRNYIDQININLFFNFIKNFNLSWVIFIGKEANLLEDEFDDLIALESIKDDQLLNIITTSHDFQRIHKAGIENILYEYLVMSHAGLDNYQLFSFLDTTKINDKVLYENIIKQLSNPLKYS